MRGTSMPDVAAFNEKLVLQAVRRSEQGLSQAQISRQTGLSRQAVSLIARRLLDQGLLVSAGQRNGGRGKPHTVLQVDPRSRLAVGVHLDPGHVTIVLVDMLARPILSRTLAAPGRDPEADIARVVAQIDAMRSDAGITGDGAIDETAPEAPVLGIGIAAPGGVDRDRGVIVDPPWLSGWHEVDVVARLEAATGLPALLVKDTHAALTAEVWAGGLADAGTVLYLYIGDGVGSAVAEDGRVLGGGHGRAGEIGHVPLRCGLEAGGTCNCGRSDCQSQLTDARAILARARKAGVLPDDGVPRPQAMRQLAECADAGDVAARAVLVPPGRALAETMRLLCAIHDPDRVIIGGPYGGLVGEGALPMLRRATQRIHGEQSVPVDVVSSQLGPEVGAIGAASVLLERELNPGRLGRS